MVLWDEDSKAKVEDKLVGSKRGEASTPKPTIVREVPVDDMDEEAARA